MWQLMLLLVIGEAVQDRRIVSEHATRQACAVAAHNHRAQAIKTDGSNTIRVYWCVNGKEAGSK
jgi:hypothetical protein